jgi:bacterioferritin (cytochrome b1)
MADPPAVVVRQLLRFLEVVYNMQVFRLSTQGMLSVVLMDSTAMRDILTLDLQYERQTVTHLQQEIVTLQTSVSSGTRSVPSSRSSCSPEVTLLR